MGLRSKFDVLVRYPQRMVDIDCNGACNTDGTGMSGIVFSANFCTDLLLDRLALAPLVAACTYQPELTANYTATKAELGHAVQS